MCPLWSPRHTKCLYTQNKKAENSRRLKQTNHSTARISTKQQGHYCLEASKAPTQTKKRRTRAGSRNDGPWKKDQGKQTNHSTARISSRSEESPNTNNKRDSHAVTRFLIVFRFVSQAAIEHNNKRGLQAAAKLRTRSMLTCQGRLHKLLTGR